MKRKSLFLSISSLFRPSSPSFFVCFAFVLLCVLVCVVWDGSEFCLQSCGLCCYGFVTVLVMMMVTGVTVKKRWVLFLCYSGRFDIVIEVLSFLIFEVFVVLLCMQRPCSVMKLPPFSHWFFFCYIRKIRVWKPFGLCCYLMDSQNCSVQGSKAVGACTVPDSVGSCCVWFLQKGGGPGCVFPRLFISASLVVLVQERPKNKNKK
jgi:hypothetical protein